MKSGLLAAAAALFTGFTVFSGFSTPASAEAVKYADVRNWGIYNNGTYCTASAKYENDSIFQFNFGVNGGASIVIWNFSWEIPKGKYEVAISVDRTKPVTWHAEADGYYVMMPWQLNEEQINIMSNGVVFRAMVGRQLLEYNLAGSREMLRSLMSCVASISPSNSNPFSSSAPQANAQPADPFAETASNPYRRM